ncbi:MAG: hypothetical protein M3530_12730, partial [Thermoproteota archaeon]|nr:hypothetical protein [Thermoproteota archaeon]
MPFVRIVQDKDDLRHLIEYPHKIKMMRRYKICVPWFSLVRIKVNMARNEMFLKSKSMSVSLLIGIILVTLLSFFALGHVEVLTNLTSMHHNASGSAAFLSPQQSIWEKNFSLVWQDNSTGNNEINLRNSFDGGITFRNATNLSDNVGSSQSPQIQALGNTTFVVWQDNS